jgi:hypothetical protein
LLPALAPASGSDEGVASGETAGGWTVLVLGLARALRNDGSSGRSRFSASEGVGAGPIAAPTAKPIASIAAASTAVMRGDGARKGDFGLFGVLFIEWSEIPVNQNTVRTRKVPDHVHKIPNVDRVYGDMLCSPLHVVNSLSIEI